MENLLFDGIFLGIDLMIYDIHTHIAGFNADIPLDEVINTMDLVGKALPSELRCTGKGGLAITATSIAIQEKLEEQKLP